MLPGNPENVTKGAGREKMRPAVVSGDVSAEVLPAFGRAGPASRTQAALTDTALFTGPDGTRLRFERLGPRCSPVPLRTPQPSPDAELARGSPAAARLAARLARPPPGPPARDAGQACWTRARAGGECPSPRQRRRLRLTHLRAQRKRSDVFPHASK